MFHSLYSFFQQKQALSYLLFKNFVQSIKPSKNYWIFTLLYDISKVYLKGVKYVSIQQSNYVSGL